MQTLKTRDLIALGFMTFALFLGAGNIIFPPMVGQGAGEHAAAAATGFLLTGVGLPLLTVVALARVGGGMDALTSPVGRKAGMVLGLLIYLILGPLFATPRTATVSFEMGFAPFMGHSSTALFIYSAVYFALVMGLSLFPGKLIDNIGKLITPVLILALAVLGAAAVLLPAGEATRASGDYLVSPLTEGFLEGYQTMDALGALAFGIVIVNAIRDRGISDTGLQTRYAIVAGVIAAVGLGMVYLSLIHLGATSQSIAPQAQTGVLILTRYVDHTFGPIGSLLLAVVISLACLTTAVGLVSACGAYFSQMLRLPYRAVVVAIGLACILVSNQGLAQLIAVSGPVLVGIYPLAIALVVLSLLSGLWRNAQRVFAPVLAVALLFGLIDAARAAGWQDWLPAFLSSLPGNGMGWALPVAATLVLAALHDRLRPAPAAAFKPS
ncbi:branched-chain amino acid transport system II carrier protein [Delftia tsuruhatensis]|uniref:branched-chain amino acid transport system II carrier protein n=1 Tax=Delftia tsuruhatensis TaxID=180282 RepID=UPI002444BDDC|nr:branched-chain amino acid transport system II carrier protein [Delftia tsuruhatensis]MDH0776763.1 branched-chain amino acid transport system II carrier protein [Delftia tsuruhatensis]MDH1460358.1 branched-chain amino acid transport system II carrier protein [Delftia tsuruhatensis]MDH1825780.1 branched-chain amino acid transport system II carrier protein [Delftia tsuruhatensis]WGG12353.1 branched-chain amino acid transport system II carrier protein [Delftia tsuruhatensis]